VDVRAEVLDLKLRVEDLETALEQAGPEQQIGLMREVLNLSERLQAEITTLRAELARARGEIGEEFAAVGTEIAGVRREVASRPAAETPETAETAEGAEPGADVRAEIAVEFAVVRSEIQREFDFLRSEVLDLSIKLERLQRREH
jgi:hypothetical protein